MTKENPVVKNKIKKEAAQLFGQLLGYL